MVISSLMRPLDSKELHSDNVHMNTFFYGAISRLIHGKDAQGVMRGSDIGRYGLHVAIVVVFLITQVFFAPLNLQCIVDHGPRRYQISKAG